jgi:hypothetical protein
MRGVIAAHVNFGPSGFGDSIERTTSSFTAT